MLIGITGGIGSGKSTIARALEARGFTVYDCDKEAKRIIAENKDVQQQIITLLGPESFKIVQNTKIYNTSYVAKRVFTDPTLLTRLNAIIHPAVKADILSLLPSTGRSGGVPLFVESAILYEAGLDTLCNKIILVDAPEDIRIARTIARDYNGLATPDNINKVRARICAQKHEQKHFPSITLNNDGTASMDQLVQKVLSILQ